MEKEWDENKLKEAKENLELHKKQLELVKKELEIKKKLYDISEKYARRLKPEYEYETKDEFWQEMRKLNHILHAQELNSIESNLKHLEMVIREKETEILKNGGDLNGE